MKTTTNVKAGLRRRNNHNESMKVRSSVKAGLRRRNGGNSKPGNVHGIRVMNVRTGVKAGWVSSSHK